MADVKPLNEPKVAMGVASAIFVCHFTGLFLKIVYYKYFHVWKDITVRISKHGIKRGDDKTYLIQCCKVEEKEANLIEFKEDANLEQ